MPSKPITKTSETHPLRIDTVAIDGLGGMIGLTFCPGKVQYDALSGHWERDLCKDVQAIREWGATAVVNLLEDHEMRLLQVPDLGMSMGSMAYHHLPIRDAGVPGQDFERVWEVVGAELRRRLTQGEKIVIHCKGGLGRTGSIAARLLVELGLDPDEAIRRVRQARPGAIETRAQEEYVRKQKAVPREAKRNHWQTPPDHERMARDRFLGCLLGGAVGDALGAPVEFMSREKIIRQFGPGGIRDFATAYGRLGAITDDTQMTLFTAEGMIRAHVRSLDRGISSFSGVTANAYQRWLQTQGVTSRCSPFGEPGWLITNRELHARRAPGNTCLTALQSKTHFCDTVTNDSKGCGGVMRVAPVGLFGWHHRQDPNTVKEVFNLGMEIAAITHGHPTGSLPAGVMAVLIMGLTEGVELAEALRVAGQLLVTHPGHEETLAALDKANTLARQGMPAEEAIPALGQGWVAEEALAIAVYCASTAQDFAEGIIRAVNHDGDSDSTGSMTGNLLGARWGASSIPSRWLEHLELRELITELSEDLLACISWDHRPDSEDWNRISSKYPPH